MAAALSMAFDWFASDPERTVVIAAVVVGALLVVVFLLVRRRRERRGTGTRSEGLLLVPDAPPEDVEVVSNASILGVEPAAERSRLPQAAIALLLLLVTGMGMYAWLMASPSESEPATRSPGGAQLEPGEDRPVRQVVESALDPVERGPGEVAEEEAVDEAHGTRMISWSGNRQQGEPDRPLRRAISVVVRDSLDRPLEGISIHFQTPEGGGRTDPERVQTNELGLATSTWWLGNVEDSLRVDIRAAGRPDLHLRYTATFTEQGRERLAQDTGEEEDASATPASASERGAEAPAPRPLAALRPRASLAVGGIHTCYLTQQDEATCWGGEEGGGRLRGEGADAASDRPTLRTIVAGVFHTCGLTAGGRVLCWPARAGDAPNLAAPAEPIALPSGAIPVDVVAGSEHSCTLVSSGAVYCWGRNAHGQLGDGTTDDSAEPVRVRDLPPAAQLSTGWLHTCALARDGTSYCWGANAAGQLGDGTNTDRAVARRVATDARFTMLTAGSAHTCARAANGVVFCWGANGSGQLGTGAAGSATPVRVESEVEFTSVVAGGTHTCGLSEDARAWCWGGNRFGQLGVGSSSNAPIPTRVVDDHEFVALETGAAHTCGQVADEQVYCWGNNIQGQLGDGTRENRSRPVLRRSR